MSRQPGQDLTLERTLDEIDDVVRQMRQVAQRFMSDGLAVTNGAPEQMGDVGLTLVDPLGRGHMYGAASCWHPAILEEQQTTSSPINRF